MTLPWETPAEPFVSDHPATLAEERLLEQCTFGQGRRGGPGGQNRNKVETAVVLTHDPSGVSAQASERRHMQENKSLALFRLRLALATQLRTPVPIGTIGTDRWRGRLRRRPRRKGELVAPTAQIEINPRHKDFPALLAEALDVIAGANWDLKAPAIRLDVSPSQLVKLLRLHPPAFARANAERASRGMHALK